LVKLGTFSPSLGGVVVGWQKRIDELSRGSKEVRSARRIFIGACMQMKRPTKSAAASGIVCSLKRLSTLVDSRSFFLEDYL
jgi:hypothetical protein